MRTRTASLLLCSALLILAGCDGGPPSSPESAPSPTLARSHNGYFIQMPIAAKAPGVDASGGAIITATSNLPDGTLAYVTSDFRGQADQEIFLLHRFVGGTLNIRKSLYCPPGEPEVDFSRGFNIQVVVVPDISLIYKGGGVTCASLATCGRGPYQPRSVQSVLGRNFERLTGDTVTTILGTPALVASAHYAWPKDACRPTLDVARGAPEVCPRSSTATINEDEAGANVEAVAGSVATMLRKNRICELYNFTSAGFRRATTWSEFRDRFLRWKKRPTAYAIGGGACCEKGPETVGVLKSPTFVEALYLIWGRRAARAHFVAHASGSGTRWEITELRLYDGRPPY